MCRPFSCYVLRPIGDAPLRIVRSLHSDSHSAIMAEAGIADTREIEHGVRCEFVPRGKRWDHSDDYELTVDEPSTPDWFDADIRARVVADCQHWIEIRIICTDRAAVLGECWIISGKVKIGYASRCKLFIGHGSDCTIESEITDTMMADLSLGGTLTTGDIGGTLKTGIIGGTLKTGIIGGTLTTGYISGTLTTGGIAGGTLSDTVKKYLDAKGTK